MGKGSKYILRFGYILYVNTRFGPWLFQRSVRSAHRLFPNGHTATDVLKYDNGPVGSLNVWPVPFAKDNYAYVIWHEGETSCALVDPADAEQVMEYLSAKSLHPVSTLITHKHWDHAGGLTTLLHHFPHLEVIAPPEVEIPRTHARMNPTSCISQRKSDEVENGKAQVRLVEDGQNFSVQLGREVHFTSLHTPGHTEGHMCYILHLNEPHANAPLLFSGDCLFLGGMGRFFEGTPEVNLLSLEKLLRLPHETKVFPGHEYSLQNLSFGQLLQRREASPTAATSPSLKADNEEKCEEGEALLVSCPGRQAVHAKRAWCSAQRRASPPLPTIPSTLAEELYYNPFLRVAAANSEEEVSSLAGEWAVALGGDSSLRFLEETATYRRVLTPQDNHSGDNAVVIAHKKGLGRVEALKVALLKKVRNLKDSL